ncbi:TetR/AcrR family transcriptional regulator [Limosilactobacillus caccae]|uniref:TetR/AcrR family transcriptional regulator n=1 Tax=Limosilactobacillus caccae TaxID=1926284 RepID=UPI0009707ED1|nr:TetR/AcrR family transcriptional regulator [Limosilactobacillus caccae]
MGKREEKAEKTRKKLLGTADRLINQRGYENVAVEDITKACGVAKGTFYNYFAQKQDLVLALGQEYFAKVTDKVDELGRLNAREAITEYLLSYIQIIRTKANIVLVREWIRYVVIPDNQQQLKLQFILKGLERLLTTLSKRGELSNNMSVDEMARMLMTHFYGVLLMWAVDSSRVIPEDEIKKYCAVQLPALVR